MKTIGKFLSHIFIDGLSGMGLGLFSTLIIGTIMKQIGDLIGGDIGMYISTFAIIAQRLTGAGIGVGVAYKFKESVYVTLSAAVVHALVVAFAVALVVVANYWFFGTEIGAAVRATGDNPNMIRANGIDTDATVILGLLLSNALVAVSGALIGQDNGFADVGMGTGTIVIGLASVIVGEVLFGTRNFMNWLISVVLGSIAYRVVIAVVLQMGMPPNDLKLFTAVLVAIALVMPLIKKKFKANREVA